MAILVYYLVIFISGSIGAVSALFIESNTGLTIFQRALLGSISMALAAASAAYIRKLYKLCFNFTSEQDSEDQLFLKRLGTIVYFFARPLFSILFALLVVAGVRSGIILTSSPSLKLDEGFIYLTMVSSFYVGFLSGDFIKKLESKGLKTLESLIG
ncbi:MAG: hypothetical protein IPN42_01130 [Methylococcaceae bacterium]|nr:hypothetical protein [Methylococcaceae bacterium]